MNKKFKKILTSAILLLVCTTLVFFAMGSDTANAWSPPGAYGNANYVYTQSSIPIWNYGSENATGHSYGATQYETISSNQWHAVDSNRYGIYVMTIEIDDLLYYAMQRGNVTLSATSDVYHRTQNIGIRSVEIKTRSFISVGEITGTGLGRDDFIEVFNVNGPEQRDHRSTTVTFNNRRISTTPNVTPSGSEAGRYIRFGMVGCINTGGSGTMGQINSINMSLSIYVNDYFVGTVSSAQNTDDFGIRQDINAYFRNQGDLHNASSVGDVVGNANYGVMENSMTTGSSMGPNAPNTTSISSLPGSPPSMNPVSVAEGAYTNGVFTPQSLSYSMPTFGGVSVSDMSIPSAVSLPSVQSVQESNAVHSIPNTLQATQASQPGPIAIDTFEAKEPADPYRWKNPLDLDPSLNTQVQYDYNRSPGFLYWKHTYNIRSSGTINFDMSHKYDGWADELVIRFHTNDQDMHVVLAENRNIRWGNDKDNKMEVVGTGRVFLYLMGNNHLFFDADYGTIDESGNFIGTSSREPYPRLFFIGIGGNIDMEFIRIKTRAAIYMPHGRTATISPGANRVKIVSDSDKFEINGIVVTDLVEFSVQSSGKFTFYRAYDSEAGVYRSGLPDNIFFDGQERPLNYFLQDPAAESSYANYKWRNTGIYYN